MQSTEPTFVPLPDLRPLFFDHIPKTGGTSVREFLRSRLGDRLIACPNGARVAELLPIVPAEASLCGHFSFLPGDQFDLSRYFLATVLRDPVDRLVSSYYYARSQGRQGNPYMDRTLELPIGTWIEWAALECSAAVFDGMARHLAAFVSSTGTVGGNASIADAAIEALERFDLIGFTEDLEPFFDALCLAQGLAPPPEVPRKNVNPDRAAIDPALHELIAQHSPADTQLYARARELAHESQRRIFKRAAQTLHAQAEAATVGAPVVSRARADAPNIAGRRIEFGSHEATIIRVQVADAADPNLPLRSGRDADILIEGEARQPIDDLTVGIALRADRGPLLHGTNTRLLCDRPLRLASAGVFSIRLRFFNRLIQGHYSLAVTLHRGLDHTLGCYHWLDPATEFAVGQREGNYFEGFVDLQMRPVELPGEVSAS